jgi:hypothetical protein
MVDVTIELSDEAVAAIMWAAEKTGEPVTVGEYISTVMSRAAESYAKQRDAEQIETLGRAALESQKTAAVTDSKVKR